MAETSEAYAEQPLIMVIDDSHAVRTVIELSFRRVGITSIAAFPDGLAAFSALSKGEVVVPDLLLLDIKLPRMDGYEVARILRGNADFSQTIIVMLSGQGGFIDHFRAKMVGAKDFITKPFRAADLVNRVCALLDYTPPGRFSE